jgi:hypothetical protein
MQSSIIHNEVAACQKELPEINLNPGEEFYWAWFFNSHTFIFYILVDFVELVDQIRVLEV